MEVERCGPSSLGGGRIYWMGGVLSDHLSCQSDLTYLAVVSNLDNSDHTILVVPRIAMWFSSVCPGFYATPVDGMVSGVQAWQACPHNVSPPIAVWCRETRSDCSKK